MYKNPLEENKVTIEISIPVDLTPYVKNAENDNLSFGLLLYPLIQKGDMSYGKAAEILGVTRLELIDFYGENELPYFTETPEQLDADIDKLLNDKRLCL